LTCHINIILEIEITMPHFINLFLIDCIILVVNLIFIGQKILILFNIFLNYESSFLTVENDKVSTSMKEHISYL